MRIEIQNLTVEHPGGMRAITDFSTVLDSSQSSAYALLGANGAGKSTLLQSLLGLVPIVSGTIQVDGLQAGKKTWTALRRRIGMVFQNADDQLFSQTVTEDVAFGPGNMGLSGETVSQRVTQVLELLGISHLAERDVTRLSGGEKRRVALAGVLAMEPDAILLDEPTSMLDPRGCRELGTYLASIPALKIIATHDLDFAALLCPKALILRDGKLFTSGPTSELLADRDLLLSCGLA